MALHADTIQDLANALNIARQTCSKKIETISGWTNDEIAIIAKRYDLDNDEIITMFDLRRLYYNPAVDDYGNGGD